MPMTSLSAASDRRGAGHLTRRSGHQDPLAVHVVLLSHDPRNENVFSFLDSVSILCRAHAGAAGARLVPPWTTSTPGPGRTVDLDVSGLRVATHDDGPAGAATLTFLHGFPSSSHDVLPLLEQACPSFTRRRRLPGLRGVGQAARPPLLDSRRGRRHRSRLGPLRRQRHGAGRARLRRVGGTGAARPPAGRRAAPPHPGSPGWSG